MLALAPCAQPKVHCAQIDAGRPALVFLRDDRAVRRPPVPAEPVEAARQRHGRRGRSAAAASTRRLRRVGRIAGEARRAHHAVIQVVERLQRRVVDRPVVGDAIERSHPEVGGVEARRMGARTTWCCRQLR